MSDFVEGGLKVIEQMQDPEYMAVVNELVEKSDYTEAQIHEMLLGHHLKDAFIQMARDVYENLEKEDVI